MANNLTTVTASAVKGPTLKPSPVVSSTASLNESIGVPGWQIVHHGDLPVVTLSNGGQSLIGYNAGIQTVSATPTLSTSTSPSPSSTSPKALNHQITIIIIIVSITFLIFSITTTTFLFIKRNRKRREKDFELNTLELKRKSDLWNLHSNLPLAIPTTTTK